MTKSTPKTNGTAISSAVRVSGSAKVRANKHRAVKREYNGMTFDSGRELARWQELELMQKAGVIAHLVRQVPFDLAPSVVLGGRKKPAIRYVADFAYWTATGCPAYIVEDAKSPHLRNNPVFRIKQHLMKLEHGIEVKLV
jgi:hypothetical protein